MERCCNPYGKHNVSKLAKENVRKISDDIRSKAQQIGITLGGDYICSSCRMKLNDDWKKMSVNVESDVEFTDEPMDFPLDESVDAVEKIEQPIETVHSEPSSSKSIDLPRLRPKGHLTAIDASKQGASSESSGSEATYDVDGVLELMNTVFTALNLPAVDKDRLRYRDYSTNQLNQLITLLRKTIFDKADKEHFGHEIIGKLKKKYHDDSTDQNTKFKILSIMPDSWSARKIEQEMGVSFRAANNSKKLVAQHGVFFDLAKKTGSVNLSPETKMAVENFYNDERFSRTMPGIKDYKIKRQNGEKVKVQRRLLIMNLKEMYVEFKKENPNVKIGFSTFASLKPLECLTSIDANGIHCVCVCTYHQNVELCCNALKEIRPDLDEPRKCMDRMLCANPKYACHMLTCKNCPGAEVIHDTLTDFFLDHEIDEITYKQWLSSESEYFFKQKSYWNKFNFYIGNLFSLSLVN